MGMGSTKEPTFAMNTIHRTIAISLFPIFATLPVSAQQADKKDSPAASANHEMGTAWRASKLMGADLKTTGGESIGSIKDVVLDLESGDIVGVVVSAGGFLGVADTVSVIPASALSYDAAAKAFTTSHTKEKLGKAPQFKASEWGDNTDSSMMEKLRGMRDAIGGDVSKPDNTAQNEKDMKEKTLTPMDQGSSEADVKTTKDIRSAVVGSDLSFNAKNIKIITRDGRVALRGVVESKEEHMALLKLVKDHAGDAKITDELSHK